LSIAAAKNLTALTSIRFLAALRVAIYHLVNWDNRTYWRCGLMATAVSVSYFFVSSGFLLTYTYGARFDRDEMNYSKFWLGRCVRLLPVYFLVLLVALPVLLRTHTIAPGKMVLTILLLQIVVSQQRSLFEYPCLGSLEPCFLLPQLALESDAPLF
jgi:peptidoglycan/LPS O-acetylase OafA/YrhL